MTKHDAYLLLDALYRIHEDLFHSEFVRKQAIAAEFRIARLRTNSVMGTAVVGALGIVAVLVSTADITWTSAPALVFYAIAVAVIGLWWWQVHDAREMLETLGVEERFNTPKPLHTWPEFMIERIAMYGARISAIQEALREAQSQQMISSDPEEAARLGDRIESHRSNLEFCLQQIASEVQSAERLHSTRSISTEDYRQIIEWAHPHHSPT